MCTVIVLYRPAHRWPVLIAANRDEKLDRAWDPPDGWWPEHPMLVGGRDRTAGGTWMALGPGGVVAAVLNRPGSLGPAEGKRSRGALPLLAATAPTASAAADSITALSASQWRPFNMVVADARQVIFLRGLGEGTPEAFPLSPRTIPTTRAALARVAISRDSAPRRRRTPTPMIGPAGRRCWRMMASILPSARQRP
jgi:uncharacterized protein with NRDE domain